MNGARAFVSVLILFSALAAGSAVAGDAKVIANEADMYRHLNSVPLAHSPLRYLSAGARERFLTGIVFTDEGVGSFPSAELASELKPREAAEVLKLFGLEKYAAGMFPQNRGRNTLRHIGENNMWCEANDSGFRWCVPIDGNTCTSACR